jgi:hypothetical protein
LQTELFKVAMKGYHWLESNKGKSWTKTDLYKAVRDVLEWNSVSHSMRAAQRLRSFTLSDGGRSRLSTNRRRFLSYASCRQTGSRPAKNFVFYGQLAIVAVWMIKLAVERQIKHDMTPNEAGAWSQQQLESLHDLLTNSSEIDQLSAHVPELITQMNEQLALETFGQISVS